MTSTPHSVYGGLGSVLLSFLFFAVPGTVLGIGYVSRIRKERERLGLGAGLFAALLYPTVFVTIFAVILIIHFGIMGFLIMLTVIGIPLGVCAAVRYWLRN